MDYIYTVKWTQPYHGWYEWQAKQLEQKLESSDLSEAKSIIERIMKL
jgi:hypothetical protein